MDSSYASELTNQADDMDTNHGLLNLLQERRNRFVENAERVDVVRSTFKPFGRQYRDNRQTTSRLMLGSKHGRSPSYIDERVDRSEKIDEK